MEILFLLIGLVFMIPAYGIGSHNGSKARITNIDYKERWEGAIALLTSEEKITDDQYKELKGEAPKAITVAPSNAIYKMNSWDRAALEITRAKRGLEPEDDLRHMQSWDIADVMNARIKYAHLRKDQK